MSSERDQLIIEHMKDEPSKRVLYCHDIARVGLWNTGKCCQSCHEDYEELGYDLCITWLPNGQVIECCCSLSNWIQEK